MEAIIVVDAGTTSIRAVLHGTNGTVLHIVQQELPPKVGAEGHVEQDATAWTAVLDNLLARICNHAKEQSISIQAVALTSFRSAVVPVDSAGHPLHPAIMWQDKRTDSLCNRYTPLQSEIFNHTGATLTSVFSAPKIVWLLENEPAIAKKTACMAGIMDLFVHHLTGRFATDASCAGRSSLMHIATKQWDPWLLDLFGIDSSILPEIVEPGSITGTSRVAITHATGLPSGTPVIVAGGDQQCAALGSGLTGEHRIVSNTGTGSYVVSYTPSVLLDAARRVFCVPSAIPGAYHLEAGMKTTGSVYRWFAFLCSTGTASPDFKQLDTSAAAIPVGSEGVLALPHFQGSGSPFWNPSASGVLYGLSLGTTQAHIARAILEAIAVEIARNANLLENLVNRVEAVVSSGGMARSPLYNQILADVTGKIVEQPANCEATALGAWMNAAVTLGIYSNHTQAYESATLDTLASRFHPDQQNHILYQDIMLRSNQIIHALYGN